MAKRKYKCNRCSRTFSMPAHLARHKNTIHGAGGGKKARAKTVATRRAKVGRPKGRVLRTGVSARLGAPRVVGEMRAYRNELMAESASLQAQIDAVDRALGVMGLATPAGPRPRRTAKKKVRGKARPTAKAKGKRKAKAKAKARKSVRVARSGAANVRAGSLRDYIGRVLKQRSKPMSPAEIGTSVVKAGFKTKAKDITKAVSNTLPKMTNIKKVGFGKYKSS